MDLNRMYLAPALKAIEFADIVGFDSGYDETPFFLVAFGHGRETHPRTMPCRGVCNLRPRRWFGS